MLSALQLLLFSSVLCFSSDTSAGRKWTEAKRNFILWLSFCFGLDWNADSCRIILCFYYIDHSFEMQKDSNYFFFFPSFSFNSLTSKNHPIFCKTEWRHTRWLLGVYSHSFIQLEVEKLTVNSFSFYFYVILQINS